MAYFVRDAREMGPGYHCGAGVTCARPEKDLAAEPFQCPKCDLSRRYQAMLKNTQLIVWERFHNGDLLKLRAAPGSVGAEMADLAKFPWPFPAWPLDRVLQVYNYVARQLSDSDGRILDGWDGQTAMLARIIVEERNQADFIDHHNRMAQLRNSGKGQAGGVQVTEITRRR